MSVNPDVSAFTGASFDEHNSPPTCADIIQDALDPDSERRQWHVHEDNIQARVLAHNGPVFVDLDETLYLRNSTEEFIGLATPNILAAYALRLLDLARPWRVIGGPKCRDNFRILFILIFFPWAYWRWQRYCAQRASSKVNVQLRDTLHGTPNQIIIASNGYKLLIQPMISALELPNATLVCCHLLRLNHRRDGKLALLSTSHGQELIAKSLVITDSYSDADLLRACKSPCLTLWKDAAFEKAFNGLVYLPGDYLSKVKRPKRGVMRNLVMYDLLPWILVGLSASINFYNFVGLIALFFSMWSVYEIGYFDNDRCAVKFESDPNLTPEAQKFVNRSFEAKAWITALALGALGVWLVHPIDFFVNFAIWVAVLLALFGTYWLYNRIDKSSRVWLYPVLQLFRFGALLAIVAVTPIAYAAIFAQLFSRWMHYIIYRYQRSTGATGWPKIATDSIRLMFFLLLMVPVLLSKNWAVFLSTASLCSVIFVYAAWKYDFKTIARAFHRLDKIKRTADTPKPGFTSPQELSDQ
jgi:hypothetical protein